jgi:hypothetical protein
MLEHQPILVDHLHGLGPTVYASPFTLRLASQHAVAAEAMTAAEVPHLLDLLFGSDSYTAHSFACGS